MSSRRWTRWQAAGGLGAFALACVVGSVACDGDVEQKSAGSTDSEETSDDEGVEQIPGDDPKKGFQGPTTGGTIPQADRDATTAPPPPDFSKVVADTRCCNVTFVLPDATNDEAVASFGADFGPGSLPGGTPLTYASGAWSAQVCMPVGVLIHYGFRFGLDADAGPDELRIDPDSPHELDSRGAEVNVFGPVNDCADVDASTGKSP